MNKKQTHIVIIFLIVACFVAFGRIVGNDFINFDDPGYITENYHVQLGISFQNIQWAFTTVVLSNWHPLTMISHMLDWSLFGANASGHHFVSLLMHIGAVIFLFLFLNKTTNNLWPSAFAAALFALHPLRVESVAWAAERKDVLSMFFGMEALYAYASYADSSKYSRYFICLILFALSLLSKPMLVTLPFILLLLDYWPLQRWQKAIADLVENRFKPICILVLEKAPFFLLTIVSSMTTLYTQKKTGAVSSSVFLPFIIRAANAIVSYVTYLGEIFYPVKLAVFYPYQYALPVWKILFSTIILLTITFAVLYSTKKLPCLFVGWFWYLGALFPVIGFVQIGRQSMADRYTYLPSIGIAIMLAWGMPLLFRRINIREKILFPLAIAVLCVLSLSTWMQCGYWKNSYILFDHALRVTKDNDVAHGLYGLSLFAQGKIEESIGHYNKAINLSQYPVAEFYMNRGVAYFRIGQQERALEDYNKAIRLKPSLVMAYRNRAVAYFTLGNRNQGCLDAQKACELGNCKTLAFARKNGYCR